jgi:protein-S-isoprenylcysteine O-methyltransferase Ste14
MLSTVHRLFGNARLRSLFLKLRVPLGILAGIGILALLKREWFFAGLAVSVFGTLSQLWCFACIKTSKVLAHNGPYVFVRNPMYLARFFLVLGLVLMTGNPWIIVTLVVVYYFYMVNRVKREEAKLAEVFGEPYREYCRTVPRFIPSARRASSGRILFASMECFQRNHGSVNLVVMLVVYAVCAYRVFGLPTQ